jgi:hypothetical protein
MPRTVEDPHFHIRHSAFGIRRSEGGGRDRDWGWEIVGSGEGMILETGNGRQARLIEPANMGGKLYYRNLFHFSFFHFGGNEVAERAITIQQVG